MRTEKGRTVSSTVPLWLAAVIGFMPSAVAIAALMSAESRDKRRVEHEREERFRGERIGAYQKLLAATVSAHVDDEQFGALAAAYSEISLLARSDELRTTAEGVFVEFRESRKAVRRAVENGSTNEAHTADVTQALQKAYNVKDRFLELARKDLGVEGHSSTFRDLEESIPSEDSSGPEARTPGRRVGLGAVSTLSSVRPRPAKAGQGPSERRPWWRKVLGG